MDKRVFWYAIYSCTVKWLPVSWRMKSAKKIRGWVGRKCILSSGNNINIEHGACFPRDLKIGSNSSLGINCHIQSGGVTIGNNVLMGMDVMIFTTNHEIQRTDIPICFQGNSNPEPVTIEDDVWIGARCITLPGVTVKRGCVVGAGTVLTKTFPEYSIIVGNPGKIVKNRETANKFI